MSDSEDCESHSVSSRSLETIINDLALNDRSVLHDQLRELHRNGHIYHSQWPSLKESHPDLVATSFEVLRKYESNGLQLRGYGCWLFERVVVSVGLTLPVTDGNTDSESSRMLEMLLRVLLEHKTISICSLVFWRLCSDDHRCFATLCDIGFRIYEELPVPIKSENFSVLFHFTLHFLDMNWSATPVNVRKSALMMLSVMASRVEGSLLTEYCVEKAFVVGRRMVERCSQHTDTEEQKRDYTSCVCVLFEFLRCLVPLHHSHASQIGQSGLLQVAIDHVIHHVTCPDNDIGTVIDKDADTHIRTTTDEDTDFDKDVEERAVSVTTVKAQAPSTIMGTTGVDPEMSANERKRLCLRLAVQLIESTLCCASITDTISTPLTLFPQLTLSHLTTLLTLEGGVYVKDAVVLFMSTFGHFVCSGTYTVASYESNIVGFLEVYFSHAMDMIESVGKIEEGGDGDDIDDDGCSVRESNSTAQREFWSSLRLLARDSHILEVMVREGRRPQRDIIAQNIGKLLSLCGAGDDAECNDCMDVICGGAMCVDTLSILSGWLDNCWKDSLKSDERVNGILAATNVKFLKNEEGDGERSRASRGSGASWHSRGSVLTDGSAVTEGCGSSCSRSDDDRLNKLRCSFSTLDLQTSPLTAQECEVVRIGTSAVCNENSIRERGGSQDSGDDLYDNSRSSSVTQTSMSNMAHIGTAELEGFLQDWEVESTGSVCLKIIKLLAVSRTHPLGLVSVESLDLVGLSEVLVELLVDDRHGLNDEEGMVEKVIQLLTDIIPLSDAIAAVACEHVEVIIDILSDWNIFSDVFLVQSCFSALIAMCRSDKNAVRKSVLDSLDKINVVLVHSNSPMLFLAVLQLCFVLTPSFKKANYSQEVIMFNWIMKCLSFKTKEMVIRACQLIYQISLVNRPFISKACSRHDVEKCMIDILDTSEDRELIVASLRTLTVLANNFNQRPCWVHNSWLSLSKHCSNVLSRHRELSSPDLMTHFLHLQHKFEEPFNLIILAYSLEIISTIRCLPVSHFGDPVDAHNYASKFYVIFMPLVAGMLAMITRAHEFCILPENVDHDNEELKGGDESAVVGTKTDTKTETSSAENTTESSAGILESPSPQVSSPPEDVSKTQSQKQHQQEHLLEESSSPTSYAGLMSMRLEAINPVYELLGASVVNALHSLITSPDSDGNESLETFNAFADLFCTTPVCESIIFIMIQLPNNYTAQVKGIIALEALLCRGIGARILAECCTRVLTSAIISFVDDEVVLHAFCSIINILSNRSEQTRSDLVAAGVHKWLYVVMKSASPVTSPLACHAIFNLIQNSSENTLVIGNSGIIRPTLLLLEKHPDDLRVQFEGLRLITALCKTKLLFRQVKENKGEKVITAARKMLLGEMKRLQELEVSREKGRINRSRSLTNALSRASVNRDSGSGSGSVGRNKRYSGSDISTSDNKGDPDDATIDIINDNNDKNSDKDKDNEDNSDTASDQNRDIRSDEKDEAVKLEYSKDDLKDLIDISTPMKLSQQKCVVM